MAPQVPAVLFTLMLPGQVIAGASASVTVTVNEQAALFPEASVTTKVLVVIPTGKFEPEASPAVCIVLAPAQLSVPTGAT